MGKLFRYELRRLLLNKSFFGILAVCLAYGWLTLSSATILGVANTAPFSPWSFGDYLSRLLPVICVGELFFLTFFASRQERRTAAITGAVPFPRRKFAAVRCGAVLTGTAALVVSAAAMAGVFYTRLFRWSEFSTLLAPLCLTVVPAAVFCLGLGWTLGRIHPAFVYGLMAAVCLLSWTPLPQPLEFSLSGFFSAYPRTLGGVDPAFSVPGAILWGRAAYFLAGIAALSVSALFNRTGWRTAGNRTLSAP